MLECLIIGDSIAVGTHSVRPDCAVYAQVGINSKDFNKKYRQSFKADTVVISLGSNDYEGIETFDELLALRRRVSGKKVYWILPAIKPEVQQAVEDVAAAHEDWIIKIPGLSRDGVHPTGAGYKRIGEIIE